MSNAKDLLQIIGDRVSAHADVRKVFGEPITVQGRTLIPVATVRFGFGAGSGGPKRNENAEGGGGGGGVQATPAGVLEVTGTTTRFIRYDAWQPIAIAAGLGLLAGLLLRSWKASR